MAYGGGDTEHSSTAAAQGKPVDFHGQMPPLWVSHTTRFVLSLFDIHGLLCFVGILS